MSVLSETRTIDCMPFVPLPGAETTRASDYRTALNVMTLETSTQTIGGKEFVTCTFKIDTASLTAVQIANYTKVYMPMDGTLKYYASGKPLPNGQNAAADTITIEPTPECVNWWMHYLPQYSFLPSRIYITGFDSTTLVDTDGDEIKDTKKVLTILKARLSSSEKYVKYMQGVIESVLHETPPTDAEQVKTRFFAAFAEDLSGSIALYVTGLSPIAEATLSGSVLSLGMAVENARNYPRKPDEAGYSGMAIDCSGSAMGSRTTADDTYDFEGTVSFFRYRQRIPDWQFTFFCMSGHPMITLMHAKQLGYDTASLTSADRTRIVALQEASRIDFAKTNDAGKFSKYSVGCWINPGTGGTSASTTFDPETHPYTLIKHGPLSAGTPAAITGDSATYLDYSSATSIVALYNPDDKTLAFSAAGGLVSVSGSKETSDGGLKYYRIEIQLTDAGRASASGTQYDCVHVRLGDSSGPVIHEIRVMILKHKVLSVRLFRTKYEGTDGWHYAKLGKPQSVLYEHCNVHCYESDGPETLAIDSARVITSAAGEHTAVYESLTSHSGPGINVFYVPDYDSNADDEEDALGSASMTEDGEVHVFVTSGASTDPEASTRDAYYVERHELGHAVGMKYYGSNTLIRHLMHNAETYGDGDFALGNNVMYRGHSGSRARLTANQALLINEKL